MIDFCLTPSPSENGQLKQANPLHLALTSKRFQNSLSPPSRQTLLAGKQQPAGTRPLFRKEAKFSGFDVQYDFRTNNLIVQITIIHYVQEDTERQWSIDTRIDIHVDY